MNDVDWSGMEYGLGNLKIESWQDHVNLLAKPVVATLARLEAMGEVGVTEIDPEVSDTAAFCERYGTRPEQAANCIVLEAKRGERKWFAACVVLSHTQADVNGLVRRTLNARRTSFASMDEAVSMTGMEYGAITPVGLPSDWDILVDRRVVETPYVILGSGLRKSKLAVPGSFFATLPRVQVVDGLAKEKAVHV